MLPARRCRESRPGAADLILPRALLRLVSYRYHPGSLVCNALHFHLRAQRKAGHAQRRTRRVTPAEEALVDLVEFAPLRDVREHHRALDHVTHRIAVRFERRPDVAHGLPRLLLDAAGHEFERAGPYADLPREVQRTAD